MTTSPAPAPVLVGISTKSYLGYRRSLEWLEQVVDLARRHPAVLSGRVRPFVAPSAPLLESALRLASGSGVRVAAQDASQYSAGAHTGDVPSTMLAEMGVSIVELGHAERRATEGETDDVVRSKVTLAQAAGLTPLLCVGERDAVAADEAAAFCAEQVRSSGATAPLMIAYEPIWAIGAEQPASPDHVRSVVAALRSALPAELSSSPVIYGGSAGPGLLASLHPVVDGLFLGRRAHDPRGVAAVFDEAAALD